MLQIPRRTAHTPTARVELALLDDPALGASRDTRREPLGDIAPLEDEPGGVEGAGGRERAVDYVAREDVSGEGVRIAQEEGERHGRPIVIVDM